MATRSGSSRPELSEGRWHALRQRVRYRDGNTCQQCGRRGRSQAERHHITRGGPDVMVNSRIWWAVFLDSRRSTPRQWTFSPRSPREKTPSPKHSRTPPDSGGASARPSRSRPQHWLESQTSFAGMRARWPQSAKAPCDSSSGAPFRFTVRSLAVRSLGQSDAMQRTRCALLK
jgi:hypothetical protein